MVNDIIEELLDLDMELKPESLWWTSTHKDEDGTTLKVVNRATCGICPSWKCTTWWVIVSIGTGKARKGQKMLAR